MNMELLTGLWVLKSLAKSEMKATQFSGPSYDAGIGGDDSVAYWNGMEICLGQLCLNTPFSNHVASTFAAIWKSKIPKNVNFFVWHVLHCMVNTIDQINVTLPW